LCNTRKNDPEPLIGLSQICPISSAALSCFNHEGLVEILGSNLTCFTVPVDVSLFSGDGDSAAASVSAAVTLGVRSDGRRGSTLGLTTTRGCVTTLLETAALSVLLERESCAEVRGGGGGGTLWAAPSWNCAGGCISCPKAGSERRFMMPGGTGSAGSTRGYFLRRIVSSASTTITSPTVRSSSDVTFMSRNVTGVCTLGGGSVDTCRYNMSFIFIVYI